MKKFLEEHGNKELEDMRGNAFIRFPKGDQLPNRLKAEAEDGRSEHYITNNS